MLKKDYQSVFADNKQPLGPIDLGQSDLFIESAVPSQHHWDAVWEAPLWDLRRWAQDWCCQVIGL